MMPSQQIALFTSRTPATALDLIESPQHKDLMTIEANRLIEEVRQAMNHDLHAAQTLAESLAALFANRFSLDLRLARGGLAPWQKRKVQNCIENGLDGSLPVPDLAKLVRLSPNHFGRAFKEGFGQPPHAYIMRMRVERARTLLLTTSETLSQIALACGFADQSHLSRSFGRITGISPSAWRRRHARPSPE